VPELVCQHHHAPSVRQGADIVVLVKIRDIRKLSTQAMLSIPANCPDRSLYWPEQPAEGELLIVIQRLVSKDKHRVLVERRLDFVKGILINGLAEVNTRHFGAEERMQGPRRDCHL
jgi:hypothetical protein